MKRITNGITLLIVPVVLAMTGCNNGGKAEEHRNVANGSSGQESTVQGDSVSHLKISDTDQAIIDYLLPKNAVEVDWLSAGIRNGSNPAVIGEAKMMLPEHLALAKKLKALVSKKGFSTPPSYTDENPVSLTKKGKVWDKAWADKVVSDHVEILDKLTKAEITAKDTDLRQLVKDTKPIAVRHLEMARMLISKLN